MGARVPSKDRCLGKRRRGAPSSFKELRSNGRYGKEGSMSIAANN